MYLFNCVFNWRSQCDNNLAIIFVAVFWVYVYFYVFFLMICLLGLLDQLVLCPCGRKFNPKYDNELATSCPRCRYSRRGPRLSIFEKFAILKSLENGVTRSQICKEIGIGASVLNNLVANKMAIVQAYTKIKPSK